MMNRFSRIVPRASVAWLLVVLAVCLCSCKGKAGGMTYDEFVKACQPDVGGMINTTKAEFVSRVGEPDNVVVSGQYVTLHYEIKGGRLMIETSKLDWVERNKAFFATSDFSYVGK